MALEPLIDARKGVYRLKGLGSTLGGLGILVASAAAVNTAQIAGLAIRPFWPDGFFKLNRQVVDSWGNLCVTLAERIHDVRLTISGDTVPKGENAILVMNHQQMPDIPFLLPFARSKGRVGDLKFFVKDALKYVPGVGWGLVFSGSVFVKRDWSRDEAAIDRAFRAIRESSMPFWLVVFAEGTRIGPHKLAREQRKAREQKRRPLRHVLMPRTRGFTAAVRALRQRADAVYDLTLAYEKGVPTMWQFVRGLARRAHLHVRRFPVDDLPRSDEELAGWLIDRFYEKDELLDRLYRESVVTTGHQ